MHETEESFTQIGGLMAVTTCLFAVEHRLNSGDRCGSHSHSCTEIVYYRHCQGFHIQGEKRYPYRHGYISICQSSVAHIDECNKTGTHVCLGVTGCGAESLPPGTWPATPEIKSAIDRFRKELKKRDDSHQAALDLLCGQIAVEVRRMLSRAAEKKNPNHSDASDFVASAKVILETRFGQPLRIKKLADELFVSPDYLRQMFRQQIGESPLQYLLRKRVEHACELLHWTDLPIKQVAQRVGIGNPYYFSRIFHRLTGQTPSAHRIQRQAEELLTRKRDKIKKKIKKK